MADQPAWVTLTAVAITGVLSIAGNQWVERIKARSAAAGAERDARRGYEYQARQRLYTAAEPLLFQLNEFAGDAIERISDLAKRYAEGKLDEGWLTDRWLYFLPSTFYILLAPGAAFWLLRERLTFLDLSLDPLLRFQYRLASAAFEAWSNDFPLAKQAPSIPYDPNDDGKWQGLLPGERERPHRALIVGSGEAARVMTYVEFEDEYQKPTSRVNREIGEFRGIFEGFTPPAHRVLWRILVAQYFVYYGLQAGRKRYYGTAAAPKQRRPLQSASLWPATILAAAGEAASNGNLAYGASEQDDVQARAAIKVGKRYLAHTLYSDSSEISFYACPACKGCQGVQDIGVPVHGV